MPVNVAMEEPGAGVGRGEAQRRTRARLHLDGVTANGVCLRLVDGWVESGVGGCVVDGALHDLEFVSVQMAFMRNQ